MGAMLHCVLAVSCYLKPWLHSALLVLQALGSWLAHSPFFTVWLSVHGLNHQCFGNGCITRALETDTVRVLASHMQAIMTRECVYLPTCGMLLLVLLVLQVWWQA
jgi:hypothetical protein